MSFLENLEQFIKRRLIRIGLVVCEAETQVSFDWRIGSIDSIGALSLIFRLLGKPI